MSRFSKSAAEKAGWTFVHAQKEETVLRSGDTQGRSQVLPPSYRAEKYQDTDHGSTLINEEAETMGLLLERIHAYEEFHSRLEPTAPEPTEDAYLSVPVLKLDNSPKVATAKNNRDQADNESNLAVGDPFTDTVRTPKGDFSEHDFFNQQSEEAQVAKADFRERQREFELAKPIDPTATKGERNEEVTPQNFGPPNPEIEILLAQSPGPERTDEPKKVGDKSKPADTEKEARKQAPKTKGKAGSEEQPTVPTFRGSDSPPEDVPKQKVQPPAKSPAAETQKRAEKQAAKTEPAETTTGVKREKK